MEASPTEVRIEHSVEDQRGVTRGFTLLYVVIAGVGLVAAAFRPELLLGAAFFALFLVYWSWQIRRAQADEPWLVVLRPDELRHSAAGVDVRITRPEAARVTLRTRPGGRAMSVQVLQVRGRDGAKLLTLSLPGRDEATMLEAAFEEWGWPVR
jgi:hypothetical protein